MDNGYPIILILTNNECSHCLEMRGKNGWPSSDLPSKFYHKKNNKNGFTKWDEDFFETLLKGGFQDNIQRSRVIELNFEKLKSDSKLFEITFFDLPEDVKSKKRIIIKKYRESSEGLTTIMCKNKNGFVDSKVLKIIFNDFIKRYIPIKSIKRYINIFPSFIYIHSYIWESALYSEDNSLYARVSGFKTIRDGINIKEYKILKERKYKIEEIDKNPIDIVIKLISLDLKPLFFPSDH